MAEGRDGSQASSRRSFSWNINNMPLNVNISGAPARIQGNIGRMVQDFLPELQQEYFVQGGRTPNVARGGAQQHAHVAPMNLPGGGGGGGGGGSGGGAHMHAIPDMATIDMTGAGGAGPAMMASPVVMEMSDAAAAAAEVAGAAQAQMGPDENQNTPHGHAHDGSPSNNTFNLRTFRRWMEGNIPFILLLLAKIMYDHRLGILIFVCLGGTFYHANSSLRRYITQREAMRDINILWILAFLLCNIFFIFYCFDEQQLWKSLLFQIPNVSHVDVWNLLWIVGMIDFVIKFSVIALKSAIALLPKFILPHKRKGKYYMMFEYVSQFYRGLTPIVPWVHFLLDDEHGGEWFSVLLLGVYAACKTQQLFQKFKELKSVWGKFRSDVSYGLCPSGDELKEADNCCPICQDKFTDPVKLACKHIFCEDCVSMWFDRERTCPMCRANIVDNPLWRDGSTSGILLLY